MISTPRLVASVKRVEMVVRFSSMAPFSARIWARAILSKLLLLQVLFFGPGEAESRPLPWGGADGDGSALAFDGFLDNGQAGAGGFPLVAGAEGLEDLEDPAVKGRVDARTVIRDRKLNKAISFAGRDLY